MSEICIKEILSNFDVIYYLTYNLTKYTTKIGLGRLKVKKIRENKKRVKSVSLLVNCRMWHVLSKQISHFCFSYLCNIS